MKVIKDYLFSSQPNFKKAMENNAKRMQELEDESKKMQEEYNVLKSSNQFMEALIADIKQLKEGEANVEQTNVQVTQE